MLFSKFPDIPYVGIYVINRPGLLLRDPKLILDVVQKNFVHFLNNDLLVDEKIDPIFASNPFTSRDVNWRKRRIIHNRQFSTGKIKYMFNLVNQGGERLAQFLNDQIGEKNKFTMECMELVAKYTIYNIANCTMGIDPRTFDEENSEMRQMGRDIIEPTFLNGLKQFLVFISPVFAHIISVHIVPSDVTNRFKRLIKEQLEYREQHKVVRNDFFESIQEHKGEKATVEEMAIQIGGFFIDGFATSSAALHLIVYELAVNSDVQQRLAEEVDEYLLKYDGSIPYYVFQEMPYLEAVALEGLRKYPGFPTVTRVCTKSIVFPPVSSTSKPLHIQPGTPVVIPLKALHYDEKYFQDPHRFDPSRFLGENKEKIQKCTYMPFGEGPRACLGQRFALIQIKMMLLKLVSQFEIKLNPKTRLPLIYNVQTILLAVEGGIWLDIYRRTR
ncbi:hypothetical protein Trydic_g6250 [Trypoxylus dichotomus]